MLELPSAANKYYDGDGDDYSGDDDEISFITCTDVWGISGGGVEDGRGEKEEERRKGWRTTIGCCMNDDDDEFMQVHADFKSNHYSRHLGHPSDLNLC